MRIAEVIGRVTLSRKHPSLPAARYVIALPMPLAALMENGPERSDDVVVFDELGAGPGSLIGLSEGREAANPFNPAKVPVDAYCGCLLDHLALGESHNPSNRTARRR